MKTIRKSAISLALVLLATPILSGQDLSTYRKFALGTSLAALSKQIGQESRQPNVVQASPGTIQELTYWPVEGLYSAGRTEPASQILFSFYNGALYRIVVTYDQKATEGMTEEDMVQAVSARYGTAMRLYPEIDLPAHDVYAPPEKVVARWEDSQNSVNLFHSASLHCFGLAVFSKQLDAKAQADMAESAKLEKEAAPQREIDRQKKEVDDLDLARQKNKKTFQP
jgi:hypothetical protein